MGTTLLRKPSVNLCACQLPLMVVLAMTTPLLPVDTSLPMMVPVDTSLPLPVPALEILPSKKYQQEKTRLPYSPHPLHKWLGQQTQYWNHLMPSLV